MIKYTMIITSLIILYSYPILASDAVDGIGVYFDEDALYNCLPDSTNFPIQLSAFVILKNVSSF